MTVVETSSLSIDPRVGYPMFDADQHYYEAEDAMTRHLPHEFQRMVRWVDIDGRRRLILGGQVFSRMPNATYNPIAKPGSLSELFRGKNPDGRAVREFLGEEEPIRPEYRDRDARIRCLDAQGIEVSLVLPSFGLYIEEHFKRDQRTLYAVLDAYNRWVDDDWGFAYQSRIYTGPILSFIDPQAALTQIRWARERGAKFIVLRPGPVNDGLHSWSLGDPRHDALWAELVDSDMFVAFHAADAGYEADAARWGEGEAFGGFTSGVLPELLSIHHERPILESIGAMVAHGVFHRHPQLRVATIELGSKWALELYMRSRATYAKLPQLFTADPVETMRKHVWISPFYEDDLATLRDLIGVERLLFGSDWPHPEGLPTPGEYVADLHGFTESDRRLVMADNLRVLLGR
jgi:predicted TIM-barrel fold metal-dependent hydrolase